jgi:ferric-dicitrate binding protein FerR (iron transport regulator)
LAIQHNDIDELIAKYLVGEAGPDEIALLEKWQGEADDNRKYVEQFRTIFDKSSTARDWQEFNTDAAWNNLKKKLKVPEGKVRSLPPRTSNFYFLRVAATVTILAGVGFFLYKSLSSSSLKPVEVITGKERVGDTLPDGSGVFLNQKSKLAYAYDKKKKTHTVKLQGEAYFHIHHEDDKKFIVEAEGLYIRDIGTAFNVTAYPESNTVEVVVVEGEVEFFTDTNPGIRLTANGKGVYNKTTKTFSIEQPESNVLAYKTKFFSFSDTDLGSAVESLNAVYDKKIVIADSLRNCHLTVSFNDEDISEIAAVIAETLNFTIKETETEIVLEGNGCGQ